MNLNVIIGFATTVAVLFFGVLHHAKNPGIFLDSHALILVLGGTLAATFTAFSFDQLGKLWDFIFFGVFLKRKIDPLYVVHDLRLVANKYYTEKNQLSKFKSKFHMINDSITLLLNDDLSEEDIRAALEASRESFKIRYKEDATVLNAIAKYPPAFGLLGASTGMIAMMTNLGGEGGTAAIGSAMAVALVATFWGIAGANFILLPLADYAHSIFLQDQEIRNIIIEGVSMIKNKTPDPILAERLKGLLAIKERARVISYRKGPAGINDDIKNPRAS